MNLKETKGITLIALVITIIVILILAGVSISMISGNNGILNKAGEATVEHELATLQEEIAMANMEAIAREKTRYRQIFFT